MRGSIASGLFVVLATGFSTTSVFAGPTVDPLSVSPVSKPAVTPIEAQPVLTFDAVQPAADALMVDRAVATPQPDLVVPEIPMPSALLPLMAGLAVIGRKIVTGRLPYGR